MTWSKDSKSPCWFGICCTQYLSNYCIWTIKEKFSISIIFYFIILASCFLQRNLASHSCNKGNSFASKSLRKSISLIKSLSFLLSIIFDYSWDYEGLRLLNWGLSDLELSAKLIKLTQVISNALIIFKFMKRLSE